MSSLSTFPGSGCAKGKNLWEWGIFGNGFYVFFSRRGAEAQREFNCLFIRYGL